MAEAVAAYREEEESSSAIDDLSKSTEVTEKPRSSNLFSNLFSSNKVAPLEKQTDQEGGIDSQNPDNSLDAILKALAAANLSLSGEGMKQENSDLGPNAHDEIVPFTQLYDSLSRLAIMAKNGKADIAGWDPMLKAVDETLIGASAVTKIIGVEDVKDIVGAIQAAWATFRIFWDIIKDLQKLMVEDEEGDSDNLNLRNDIAKKISLATEHSTIFAINIKAILTDNIFLKVNLAFPLTDILSNGVKLVEIYSKLNGHRKLVDDLQKKKDAIKSEWDKSFEGNPLDINSSVDINRETSAIKANNTLNVNKNKVLDATLAQDLHEEKIRTKMEEADISQDNNSLDETQKQLLKDYTVFDEIIKAKKKAYNKDMQKVGTASTKIAADILLLIPDPSTVSTGMILHGVASSTEAIVEIGNLATDAARGRGIGDTNKSVDAKKAWRMEQATNIYDNTSERDYGEKTPTDPKRKKDCESTNIMLKGVGIDLSKPEKLPNNGTDFITEIYKGLTKKEM